MKAAVMLAAAVLAAIVPGLSGHGMGFSEWVNVGVLAAGGVQVWLTTNHYEAQGLYRALKTASAAVAAGGVLLISALGDGNGVSTAEAIQMVLAVLGAAGVYRAPRDSGMISGAGGRHAAA